MSIVEDLWEYFSPYGQVVDVSIKYDAVSGNSRGFGFITFSSEDAIENVISRRLSSRNL